MADAAAYDSGLLSKLIDAGDSIPVVDVLAATAGTILGAQEDVQAGQPIGESIAKEATRQRGGAGRRGDGRRDDRRDVPRAAGVLAAQALSFTGLAVYDTSGYPD